MIYDKIRPINEQVIVVDDAKEKVSRGGIIIPDNAKQDTAITGTVKAVSGKEAEVKPGDRVIYSIHAGAGNVIKAEDDKLCRVVRHSELLVKLEE